MKLKLKLKLDIAFDVVFWVQCGTSLIENPIWVKQRVRQTFTTTTTLPPTECLLAVTVAPSQPRTMWSVGLKDLNNSRSTDYLRPHDTVQKVSDYTVWVEKRPLTVAHTVLLAQYRIYVTRSQSPCVLMDSGNASICWAGTGSVCRCYST